MDVEDSDPRPRAIRAVRAARAVRDAVARRGLDLATVVGTGAAVAAGGGSAGVAMAATAAPAAEAAAAPGPDAPGVSVGGHGVSGGAHEQSVTTGADGSVTATSSSAWSAHPGAGHAGHGDDPSDDMLVQEFEQVTVREDADGNFVVETTLRVVVTYQGHTYSYDGHDVHVFHPDESSDIVLHQHESVVVHENPDGTYSVAIDAHTSVEVVPDDDGQFDAAITQDQDVRIEDDPHAHGRVDLDVDQVENVDNRGGGDADVTQVQHGDGDVFQVQNADGRGAGDVVQVQQGGHGAEQTQNADTRGGGHASQTQQGGDHSTQVQNDDGRGGAGGTQVQHAGRGSTQVERADTRDGGPVTQVQGAGGGSTSWRSSDARSSDAGPSARLDDAIPARVEAPFAGTHEAVVLTRPADVTGGHHFEEPGPAAPEPFVRPPQEPTEHQGTGGHDESGAHPTTTTTTTPTGDPVPVHATTVPDDPLPDPVPESRADEHERPSEHSAERAGDHTPDHVDHMADHTAADPAHA